MNARAKDMPGVTQERAVKLFRNGRNQAVRIPVEFELPGSEAVMRKEDGRLIIEAKPVRKGLAALLATFEPWEGDFPDLDETQPPPEDVDL